MPEAQLGVPEIRIEPRDRQELYPRDLQKSHEYWFRPFDQDQFSIRTWAVEA
jgi:hypothetical protein